MMTWEQLNYYGDIMAFTHTHQLADIGNPPQKKIDFPKWIFQDHYCFFYIAPGKEISSQCIDRFGELKQLCKFMDVL